ncbi:hypothetical protein SAY86_005375 [Trapa natans]|uniref:Uncharacterized protein n=1 Tax=Trapa natans TaxID=22666 RepID=A0AAN7QSF3_TRANT|nr:hypothetical protein SAY86_005375 [Trapa natans]
MKGSLFFLPSSLILNTQLILVHFNDFFPVLKFEFWVESSILLYCVLSLYWFSSFLLTCTTASSDQVEKASGFDAPICLVGNGGFPFRGSSHSKSRPSPLISVFLILLGVGLLICLAYGGSCRLGGGRTVVSKIEGNPGRHRAKVAELSKFGKPAKMRSKTWWVKFFMQTNLEEKEPATKKFEQASLKMDLQPACQVFSLETIPLIALSATSLQTAKGNTLRIASILCILNSST